MLWFLILSAGIPWESDKNHKLSPQKTANMYLGYNFREFRSYLKPFPGVPSGTPCSNSLWTWHWQELTDPTARFLTIALASSRMDGIERILYRAPFTYGCIFKGRENSHLQVLKYHTTQTSRTTLENGLASEEGKHCHRHSSLSPRMQVSKWQTSPLARPRATAETKSSKPRASFSPEAYSRYMSLLNYCHPDDSG